MDWDHRRPVGGLGADGIRKIETVARAFIEPNGMIGILRRDGEET